jgi:hypothetical protein
MKRGPRKKVGSEYIAGRLRNARDFHKAAQEQMVLADKGNNCSPAVGTMVTAAIAYCDTLTASRRGEINQQDHRTASTLLREAFGNALPNEQERRLRQLLGTKDEAQYGARAIRYAEAMNLLAELDAFARWAEDQLRG